MANFQPICDWVLHIEDATLSGKVVNLMDGQGLTRFGIGQHSHPDLDPAFYTMHAADALPIAEGIYRVEYWNKFLGDQINDDGVASCLLSFSINDGPGRVVKMLQNILKLTPDGVFGPITLAATNAQEGDVLANNLRFQQEAFYRMCVVNQPTDARFLTNWLHRANLVYPNL